MRITSRGVQLATLAFIALSIQTAWAQRPQERHGFWFGFGLGYGSLGCEDCDGREGSGTGYLKLGGTVSRKVLIGFEANSWVKKENDVTFSISNGPFRRVGTRPPSTTFSWGSGSRFTSA